MSCKAILASLILHFVHLQMMLNRYINSPWQKATDRKTESSNLSCATQHIMRGVRTALLYYSIFFNIACSIFGERPLRSCSNVATFNHLNLCSIQDVPCKWESQGVGFQGVLLKHHWEARCSQVSHHSLQQMRNLQRYRAAHFIHSLTRLSKGIRPSYIGIIVTVVAKSCSSPWPCDLVVRGCVTIGLPHDREFCMVW